MAKLNIGQGFSEQYILLNIYPSLDDKRSCRELSLLSSFKNNPKIPTPQVIAFDSSHESGNHLPAFYCSKTQCFFNVPCVVCSTKLDRASDSEFLYCPRCESLGVGNVSTRYSFYEPVPEKNEIEGHGKVIMLEDVFSEYAKSDLSPEFIPCAKCDYAE